MTLVELSDNQGHTVWVNLDVLSAVSYEENNGCWLVILNDSNKTQFYIVQEQYKQLQPYLTANSNMSKRMLDLKNL